MEPKELWISIKKRYEKGLRKRGDGCACYILNGRARHLYCHGRVIPFEDHASTYFDPKTRERVLVIQPYMGILIGSMPADEKIRALDYRDGFLKALKTASEHFADTHGLKLRISAEDSWHYPGETILIEYRKSEE